MGRSEQLKNSSWQGYLPPLFYWYQCITNSVARDCWAAIYSFW